jgi:hypothetical protein
MRVLILRQVVGAGFDYSPGEHDIPDKLAAGLVMAGHAKPVQTRLEAAINERAERAVRAEARRH